MLIVSIARAFGSLLPLLVFFAAPSSGPRKLTPIIFTAMVLMFYISFCVDTHARNNTLDIFLVTNYLFFYLSSGVAIITMELQETRLKLDWAFPLNNLMIALSCSILSLVVIEVVYSKKSCRSRNSETSETAILPDLAITKISLFSIGLSAIYFSLIPISSLFNSRASIVSSLNSTFSTDSGQASIGLLIAFTKIAPLCLGAYIILLRRTRKERLKILDFLAIVPSLIAINPISSARYVFLLMIITLGCAFVRIPPNRVSALLVYMGIFLAIFVFPNLDFSRNENSNFRLLNLTESFNQIANKDFDQVAMGALALQEVSDEIAPLGKQFLGELGFWIPRKYWESKPSDTSIILARATGLRNSNLSIPLWAEGWSSFRYFGLILYPWALSSLAAGIRIKGASNLGFKGMYFFLSGSVFIIQRGPLLQATGIVVFGLTTFYFLSRLENHYKKYL